MTCTRQVVNNASGHTIVVEKSTLPVGTAEVIKSILDASNRDSKESNLKNLMFFLIQNF